MLKPKDLSRRVAPNQEVDVLLHLHGFTSRSWDPYAGWRQRKSDHTVRDVDLDRIEQQMDAAITATNDANILGILAEGVGHSEFGGLVPSIYVPEVLRRLDEMNELTLAPDQVNLILSAHSGGGRTVAKALRDELDPPEVKGKATRQRAGAEGPRGRVVRGHQRHERGPKGKKPSGELDSVEAWVDHHLEKVRQVLSNTTAKADERAKAIAECPTLRAYRSHDGYKSAYDKLDKHIHDWFDAHGAELGPDEATVRAHFRVEVLEGITGKVDNLIAHERLVGGLGDPVNGPLADALIARKNPSTAPKLMKGSS